MKKIKMVWIKPVKFSPIKLSMFPKRTKAEVRLIDRNPWGDTDRDKVPNIFDCKPLNRKKQGKFSQNIPLSQAQYITVYHGTQKDTVPKIIEKGFKPGKSNMIYLTPSRKAAIAHARHGPEKIVKVWQGTMSRENARAVYRDQIKANVDSLKNIELAEAGYKTSGKRDKDFEKDMRQRKRNYINEIKEKQAAIDFESNPTILKVTVPRKTIERAMKKIEGQGYPPLKVNEDLSTERDWTGYATSEPKLKFQDRYELELKSVPKKASIKEIPIEKLKRSRVRTVPLSQDQPFASIFEQDTDPQVEVIQSLDEQTPSEDIIEDSIEQEDENEKD